MKKEKVNWRRIYTFLLWSVMGSMIGFGFFWFMHIMGSFSNILITIWYAHLLSTIFGIYMMARDK